MANLSHLNTIMIAEDEALILLDIEQTLADAGVQTVISTTTVEEALAAIETGEVQAAVLDLHLGRSGWSYDVANRLKEKGIPFIFSSGTVDIAEGFRDVPFIMKPFSTEQLVAALLQVTTTDRIEAAQ